MCHGGGFMGQNEIPRLAGQQHDYIVKQLKDFRERRRTNDAGNMASVAKTLSEEDIENLARTSPPFADTGSPSSATRKTKGQVTRHWPFTRKMLRNR